MSETTTAQGNQVPSKPKREIKFHVSPVRGKTQLDDGKAPEGSVIVESVESPWTPGAQRLLSLPEGTPKPKGTFNLAHVKSGNWLGLYKVVSKTEAKALGLWNVTSKSE